MTKPIIVPAIPPPKVVLSDMACAFAKLGASVRMVKIDFFILSGFFDYLYNTKYLLDFIKI